MFDPLSPSASPFASSSSNDPPAWPTTPHTPDDVNSFARPAASPVPPKSPYESHNGREPQIYGQPTPGLISPEASKLSNGGKLDKMDPYLRIRITNLDRNRRDILIRFDAQTNLNNFNGTTYRNVSRSFAECQRFAEQIVYSNPQTIVPALPLPQTSAPTDEEDDRLVKVMLQRWLSRISEDPVLMHDEEVRSFVESDFGYQPTIRPKRKTGSSFSLLKRGVPDEDEELLSARFELTRLETQFFDAAKAIDKLARARRSLSQAHTEMGNKLISVATTETHPPLGNALRKFGRAWHTLGDNDHAHANSESVMLGDSLGYQGLNAKAAKETLQNRSQVLEEFQSAVKATITKRRQIERLKASSNIRPEKVDEALEELEEASQIENILSRRVNGISQNLHKALITHSRHTHDDVTASLIEHARASLIFERTLRKELETLRNDVRAIGTFRGPSSLTINAGVRGSYVSSSSTAVPPASQYSSPSMSPSPHYNSGIPPSSHPSTPRMQSPVPAGVRGPPITAHNGAGPLHPDAPLSASSPGTPVPAAPEAAMNGGGRPFNGAQSMFVDKSRPTGPSGGGDPLMNSTASPLNMGRGGPQQGGTMGRSMFIEPQRGRIDQKEAARKLANFL